MAALRQIGVPAHVIINTAAGGTLAAVAAVAGQRVSIYRLILTVATTVTITIQDTSGGALSQPFAFGSSGGAITLDDTANGDPWWSSTVGLGIQLNASGAVQVSADIWYLQQV